MKKILVLVDKLSLNKKKLARYLNKNSGGKYKTYLNTFSNLFFEIRTGAVKILINGKTDPAKFDLVFVRRSGKYIRFMGAISKYLDDKKVDFIDPAFREIGLTLDKATTYLRLAIKDMPIPDTYFCFRGGVEKFKEDIVKKLGFPMIAKAVCSQRNEAIYVLKNARDFARLTGESNNEFLFQKYIDIEKEFRLLVMGEKVAVLERKSKRNYDHFKVEYTDPNEPSVFLKLNKASKQMKDLAVKCTKLLSLDVAGIDICVEKETGKNYVFEVNRGPGIVPDSKKSPELKAFAGYLKKRLFT